jgi:hypothetical protein
VDPFLSERSLVRVPSYQAATLTQTLHNGRTSDVSLTSPRLPPPGREAGVPVRGTRGGEPLPAGGRREEGGAGGGARQRGGRQVPGRGGSHPLTARAGMA